MSVTPATVAGAATGPGRAAFGTRSNRGTDAMHRPTVLAVLFGAALVLSGCGAVGRIDTAAMQTTNRAVGAPVNGPGNPPPPTAP